MEHERTPTEVAAQLWCLPEHSAKEMDVAFAQSIAVEIEREQNQTNNWVETARQYARNAEYYRGIVEQVGALLGPDAYTADDGVVHNEVLCAKVVDLARSALRKAHSTKSPAAPGEE